MIEVRRTEEFAEWLGDLRDVAGKARIIQRIDRLQAGNFGDHKSVGGDVSELRMTFGPGYRVYYTMRGSVVVILLCGGDKGSQEKDIAKAHELAKEIGDGN